LTTRVRAGGRTGAGIKYERVRLTGLKAIGQALDISCPKQVKRVLDGKKVDGVTVLRKQGNSWVASVDHLRILALRGEI
jgi:hypothetical protein